MDASQLRRNKRIRERLGKMQWLVWLLIVGLVGYYLYWRSAQVQVARIVTDEFLTRLGRGELDFIHGKLLTSTLQGKLTQTDFQKQMALLGKKLGHLEEFELSDDELSWDNARCRLIYKTSFSRAPARAIFELLTDSRGRWRLHTYIFWADNWKDL